MNGIVGIKLKNLASGLREFLRGTYGYAHVYSLARNGEAAVLTGQEYVGLYIAVAGTVTGTMIDSGAAVSFLNVPVGMFPVHFSDLDAVPANTIGFLPG